MNGFDQFKEVILDLDLDIIGVTETWLRPDTPDTAVDIPGYTFMRKDRTSIDPNCTTRGGGVGVYIRNSIRIRPISCIPRQENEVGIEQLWIQAQLKRRNISIGVGYKAPHVNYAAISGLDTNLSNLQMASDNIIFMGDFNINLLERDKPDAKFLLKYLEKHNLSQIIKDPTRITASTSTLIDHIYIQDSIPLIGTQVLDLSSVVNERGACITDHHMVTCTLKYHTPKVITRNWKGRNFNRVNLEDLREFNSGVNWSEGIAAVEIDEKVAILNNHIIQVADKFAPIQSVTTSKSSSPWITGTIQDVCKLKKKALLKYRKSLQRVDWNSYTNIRNYLSGMVRREKRAYIINHLTSSRYSPKAFWNNLKEWDIHRKPRVQCELPDELQDPDVVNTYYINAAGNIRISDEVMNSYAQKCSTNDEDKGSKFHLRKTTTSEVISILSRIKTNAIGVDGVSRKMIQLCLPHCASAITDIVNFSITSHTFPTSWKEGIIRPIPKIPSPKEPKDLRPITILTTLSKVLEKVIYKQLIQFLEKENKIPDIQSGFRRNRSTTTALLSITDDILRNIDKSEVTSLVLLDFSRAFDTLNHELLLAKMKALNLSEEAIRWFGTYLSARTQRVELVVKSNNITSKSMQIPSGVPQGSVLGPLLFIVYTADLEEIVTGCQIHQFADDTQIYTSFKADDAKAGQDAINNCLGAISKWSHEQALILNPKKTVSLLLGSKHQRAKAIESDFQIIIDGTPVPLSDSARNLGLTLDSELTFNPHVTSLRQKSFGKLKTLSRYKALLPPFAKLILTDSLILSSVDYCSVVYGPNLTVNNSNAIQQIQNACMRYTYNLNRREHTTPVIRKAGMLKMAERRTAHLLSVVHKVIKTGQPKYLRDRLKARSDIHNVSLRRKNRLDIPQHRSTKFKASFTCKAATHYNNIPDGVKSLSQGGFKQRVKEYLLSLS